MTVTAGETLAVITIKATGVIPAPNGVEIISVETDCEAGHISRHSLISLLQEFVDGLREDEEGKIDP